ncbi:transcription-repair coupling factor [Lederbergia sp. NSJ-179]|uniref:transcription-repair coupling factor n=1 Tax=Lederbergia sp. NSJ-179 TaxID=2931402 RepID=UPI001FD299D7|nr:transcription-repair coupling factor [Lederbergia sp. NSJ-179]MCJ7843036.1 transcription-repair coupling factor [Lederbergia sp. NSJ-179]
MEALSNLILQQTEIQSILSGIDEKLEEQLVSGLSGSARSVFIAATANKTEKSIIVVTHNLLQAQKIYEDLQQLMDEERLFLYPANELIAAEIGIASPELRAQRIETLNYMTSGRHGVFIVPVAGLRRILPTPAKWKEHLLPIEVGKEIHLENEIMRLVEMGYQRTDMVSAPGEFSMRGGIIDIYPLTEIDPIRIELFDTEVDSIRTFSLDDQRSKEKRDKVLIGPATESPIESDQLKVIATRLESALAHSLKKLKSQEAKAKMAEKIGYDLEQLRNGQKPEQFFKYLSFDDDLTASLLDYLSSNGLLIFDEMSRIQEMNDRLEKEEAEWYTALLAQGEMVHDIPISHPFSDLMAKNRTLPKIYLSMFLRHIPNTNPQNISNISCKLMQNFHGQMHLLKGEVERWRKNQFSVIFLAPNKERAEKIHSILEDYEIEAALVSDPTAQISGIQIRKGSLTTGFELLGSKMAVITEEEIFNKKTRKVKRKQKLSNAERIKSYSELQVGDYVVHVNHGIGKYLGIETLVINGVHKDYLHLRYQGSDQLYVPVEQIDLVQKYVASEGKEPKIYKLGGSDWKRVKKKVETSVKDIADDLIKLYAEREASKGFAFSPDGDMQRELEASFPYQETEDQLRSIAEIKRDMEKERPMDRLLCGDVGYGKTEVAIRAAFKAIMDGKQVAFLVPTTILAQQHFETAKERFQDFPIRISLLSRFRTKKQQTETAKGLKNGTIDIVIGTHRLLSKDIQFADLGLLIVDEEQRFGVTHKEKLKQLKANIDVLTLTATPIPRTLHMSMLGVRDLSVIETPPENRFPIQTFVMEYNGSLVKESIERELARGGQVYFLYNRVEDIERKTEEISLLVPEARVAYAHGQMTETELESVILSFLDGEFDVLVTTTIIETGVDIPNVNTLIVHDADRMGLSQLYQLRGRVGRSNRVAYAYFTYRRNKVLTEVAEKRLQSIKEFTELGSGFKIAMRDLSIRGAGNLLGAQQHGFIDSVGFDLYSQMLKEAIDERRGEIQQQKPPAFEVELELDAYIPDTYIKDGHQKIEMYKRFRNIETLEELEELRDEMIDRFGDYPEQVELLLTVAEIKVYAREAKLESIKQSKSEITIHMSESGTGETDGSKVFKICSQFGRKIGLGMDGAQLKITIQIGKMPQEEWLQVVKEMMKKLKTAKK